MAELTDAGFDSSFLLIGLLITFALSLLVYIYFAFCFYVIARKTGTANGWFAFVPVLNIYLMCRIAGKSGAWFLLCLVPLVNLIAFIIVFMGIAQVRGKPAWTAILLLIPPFGLVLPAYLAAGNAAVRNTAPAAGNYPGSTSVPSSAPNPSPGLCAQCGSQVTPGEVFCAECGHPVQAAAPVTVSPEAAYPAPALQQPRKSSAVLVLVIAVVGIGFLAVAGLVAWWMLGGVLSSPGSSAPDLPARIAGTLSEFPVDTDLVKTSRPDSVITQDFSSNMGAVPAVNVPQAWLPPGIDKNSLPAYGSSITSATYRTSPGEAPVAVHVLDTSTNPQARDEIVHDTARQMGAEPTGARVQSPDGEVYSGYRVQNSQQLVFVLMKEMASVLIIIYAPDPSVKEVATRLAGNIGNGEGLNDYPEVKDSLWSLPAATPPSLSLQEFQMTTPEELGLGEAQLGSLESDQEIPTEVRGVISKARVLIPPRITRARYLENNGSGEWDVMIGQYRSSLGALGAWLFLQAFFAAGQGESISIGGEQALSQTSGEERIVLTRVGDRLILMKIPLAGNLDTVGALASSLRR